MAVNEITLLDVLLELKKRIENLKASRAENRDARIALAGAISALEDLKRWLETRVFKEETG